MSSCSFNLAKYASCNAATCLEGVLISVSSDELLRTMFSLAGACKLLKVAEAAAPPEALPEFVNVPAVLHAAVTAPGEPAPGGGGRDVESLGVVGFVVLKRFFAKPRVSSIAGVAAAVVAGGVLATGFRPGRGLAGRTHFRRTLMLAARSSEKSVDADACGSYCGLKDDFPAVGTPAGLGLIATAGWILAYFVSIGSEAPR